MNWIVEELLYRYRQPKNRGKVKGEGVLTGAFGNPGCGDVVRVFVKVRDGRVVEARFEGEGCTVSQGVADMLMDRVKGMSVEEVRGLTLEDISGMIGEDLVRLRPKCSSVALNALKVALGHLTSV